MSEGADVLSGTAQSSLATNQTTSDADFGNKIAELNAWFKENPNLPQEIEPILLRRFLKSMYGDVAEAKKVIELNYAMRNKHANLFLERDPKDDKFQISRNANAVAPLPGLTPERHKIFCYRLNEVDPSVINNEMEMKIFHMLSDVRFIIADDDDGQADGAGDNLADGDVLIVDIKNYTLRHMARMSFSLIRVHHKFLEEAFPVRLKAMHVINCPSYVNRMVSMVRPLIPDAVYKLVHLHTSGLDSLYECVPKEMLPTDYGGAAGQLEELRDKWTELILQHRDYLMDPKYWKMDLDQSVQRSRWSWW